METWWFCSSIRKVDPGIGGFLVRFLCNSLHDLGFLSEEVTCFSHFRAKKGEKLIGCDLAWMNSQ